MMVSPNYAHCPGRLVTSISQMGQMAFPIDLRSEERLAKPLNYLMKIMNRNLFRS